MSDDERSARILREIFLAGFMSGLPPENVAWATSRLASVMEDVKLKAGEVLFRRGDPPIEHYFVVSGEVRLEAPELPPWTFGPRSLVGTLDVTIDRPRTRDATTTRDTHLLRLPAGEWLDMLEDNFELARRGVQGLALGVNALRVELVDLGQLGYEDEAARSVREMPAPARPLDLVERVFALRQVPVFATADVQSLLSLAEVAREVSFAPGEVIIPRGASNDSLVLVLGGEVAATHAGSVRREAFGPGSLVLGSAAVSAVDLHYDASARTSTRTLRIGNEDYFDVMEEHFALARSALKALALERESLMNERGRRAMVQAAADAEKVR